MRKKIFAFVFSAALLIALAVPVFSGATTASAIVDPVTPSNECSGAKGGGAQAVLHGAVGGPDNSPDGVAPVFAPVPVNNPGNSSGTGAVVPDACWPAYATFRVHALSSPGLLAWIFASAAPFIAKTLSATCSHTFGVAESGGHPASCSPSAC